MSVGGHGDDSSVRARLQEGTIHEEATAAIAYCGKRLNAVEVLNSEEPSFFGGFAGRRRIA